MSCTRPLKAYQIGLQPSGKPKYKICSYESDYVFEKNGSWFAGSGPAPPGSVTESLTIPCGHCDSCRLDHARDWANRCMLELKYHDDAVFLTLTYDDVHVPRSAYADPETGEAISCYTLRKLDLQKFWKRLRKAYPENKLRYFACGEYGSNTFRPHYHAIVYGLHVDDLRLYKKNHQGDQLYTSAKLDRVWSDQSGCIGKVVIGDVSWSSAAYVARYVLKKHYGQESVFYEDFNIEPEFVVMSRRPGIGYQYLVDRREKIMYTNSIDIATESGGKHFPPPKYFDRLFEEEYPDYFADLRERRRWIADVKTDELKSRIKIPYLDYLQVVEDSKKQKTKILHSREIGGDFDA